VIQASLEGDELAEDCYQEGRFLKEIGLMIEAISTRLKTIDARDCPSNQSRSVTPAPSRAFPDTQESANLQILDSWHVEQEQEQESRAANLAARARTPSVIASSPYEDIGRQRRMEVDQERKTMVNSKPSTFWREFRRPTVEARKFNGKDVAEWPEFWDWFCAGVDNDPDLPNCAKLHYLKNSLEGEALRTINGIRITEDNYKIALDRLFDKYANTELQSHSKSCKSPSQHEKI
jgi:hypothetical protein